MEVLLGCISIYVSSCLFGLVMHIPSIKEKGLFQYLKTIYYLPIIPIVNTLLVLASIVYSICDEIKKHNWKFIIEIIVGIILIIIMFSLIVITESVLWIFLIFVYQGWIFYKYDIKKVKS